MIDREIVAFRPEHAGAFSALNRAWLDAYRLYEPADEAQLAHPMSAIIGIGGAIFIALGDGVVVGTAAVIPHGADEMELAKLTVAEAARGSGIGRKLAEACIALARSRRVHRLVLVSSSRLDAALRLYESLGFARRPLPAVLPYVTADVYMELEVGPGPMG